MIESLLKTLASLLRGGINTGGYTTIKRLTGATVGVDGAAYVSGDVLGDQSPIKISGAARKAGASGIIQSVTVQDLSKQSIAVDVIFFDSPPNSTTFADNSAVDIADADLPKIIGTVSLVAGDYVAFNDNSVATKTGINIPFTTTTGDLYCALVTRGGPTYVADELSLVIGILQD